MGVDVPPSRGVSAANPAGRGPAPPGFAALTPGLQMSKLSEEYLPVENPNRSAGILLHPTSLPGPYGIGDLGPAAYGWIDALAQAKQRWWQILPLGPTGYGDSPYQAFSAFAGNPFLVSPQYLR